MMRFARWGSSLVLMLALTAPVAAEITTLNRGQAAPADGILFDAEAVARAVDGLRQGARDAAKVETLEAEVAALRQQTQALDAEAKKLGAALAIAEERERRRVEDDARTDRVLARAEKALAQYDRLVDRMVEREQALEKRIDSLERRSLWQGLLLPLGILAGALAGGL